VSKALFSLLTLMLPPFVLSFYMGSFGAAKARIGGRGSFSGPFLSPFFFSSGVVTALPAQ